MYPGCSYSASRLSGEHWVFLFLSRFLTILISKRYFHNRPRHWDSCLGRIQIAKKLEIADFSSLSHSSLFLSSFADCWHVTIEFSSTLITSAVLPSSRLLIVVILVMMVVLMVMFMVMVDVCGDYGGTVIWAKRLQYYIGRGDLPRPPKVIT